MWRFRRAPSARAPDELNSTYWPPARRSGRLGRVAKACPTGSPDGSSDGDEAGVRRRLIELLSDAAARARLGAAARHAVEDPPRVGRGPRPYRAVYRNVLRRAAPPALIRGERAGRARRRRGVNGMELRPRVAITMGDGRHRSPRSSGRRSPTRAWRRARFPLVLGEARVARAGDGRNRRPPPDPHHTKRPRPRAARQRSS